MKRHPVSMITEMAQITARARRETTARFVNLMHLLSGELLAACFQEMRKTAAPGADVES